MSNEAQVVNRFERAHGLTWEERAPLSTWHMRAVHQRISEQKPDLIWPVRPTGFSSGVRAATRKDRLMFTLGRWHLWNFLSGTHCWIRNRMIEVRVALFEPRAMANCTASPGRWTIKVSSHRRNLSRGYGAVGPPDAVNE